VNEIITDTGLLIPVDGFEIVAQGVVVHGNPTYDEWQAMLKQAIHVRRVLPWIIGDLLNAGERIYGESYTQAVDALGMEVQTLYNYASICAHVPSEMREPTLTFTHHALVAYQDDKADLLQLASDGGMTTAEFREALAETLPPKVESEVEILEYSIELTYPELAALATHLDGCELDPIMRHVRNLVQDAYNGA